MDLGENCEDTTYRRFGLGREGPGWRCDQLLWSHNGVISQLLRFGEGEQGDALWLSLTGAVSAAQVLPALSCPGPAPTVARRRKPGAADFLALGNVTENPGHFSYLGQCKPAVGEGTVLTESLQNVARMEKEMATHSRILVWKSLWTEEPGRLKAMGLHDWACVHEGGGRCVGNNKVVELKKKKNVARRVRPLLKAHTTLAPQAVGNLGTPGDRLPDAAMVISWGACSLGWGISASSDCFLISGRRQSEWVKQDSGVVYGAPSADTLLGAPDIA